MQDTSAKKDEIMLKSLFAATGCTYLALSAAISWRARNHKASSATLSLTAFVATTSIIMGLRALGTIKMYSHQTLGRSLSHKSRRLGLLERWYIAHSRAGHHTGFSLALQLVSPKDAPTLEQVRDILRNASFKFPWLLVKIHRDGVDGVDSRERLSSSANTKHTKQYLCGDDFFAHVDSDSKDYCHVRQVMVQGENDFGKVDGLCQVLEQEGQMDWHDEAGSNRVLVESSFGNTCRQSYNV